MASFLRCKIHNGNNFKYEYLYIFGKKLNRPRVPLMGPGGVILCKKPTMKNLMTLSLETGFLEGNVPVKQSRQLIE